MFIIGIIELRKNNDMKKKWILIYVWHGLIQKPELFTNKKDALKRKKEIMSINDSYDEMELFEFVI